MGELNAIGTIVDVLNWADIDAPVWNAVVVNFGRVGKLRFFAALLSDVFVVAITAARVEPEGRTLTPMEATSRHGAGGQSATGFQSATDVEYTHHHAE